MAGGSDDMLVLSANDAFRGRASGYYFPFYFFHFHAYMHKHIHLYGVICCPAACG